MPHPQPPPRGASADATAFAVTFRTNGGDAIHALHALLKIALRRFGLRCIDIREVSPAKDQCAQNHRKDFSPFQETYNKPFDSQDKPLSQNTARFSARNAEGGHE